MITKKHVIVDFMSVVQQFAKYSDIKTFKELFDKTLNNRTTICSMNTMQFVFDSYIDMTIKDSERLEGVMTLLMNL